MRRALGRGRLLALGLLVVTTALAAVAAQSEVADAGGSSATRSASTSCELGNGISHVINIVFDNVHFSRDNPNVPSDLEQMPHLLNFLKVERHRVLEPAHAADRPHRGRQPDDLHGPLRRPARPARVEQLQDVQPGRVDRPGDLVHVLDVAGRRHGKSPPTAGHDTTPSMVYSDRVPGNDRRHESHHAGAVGAVHARGLHGRQLLDREHGARERGGRPADGVRLRLARGRAVQRRHRPFKDAEIADYIGEAIHCAKGDAICADAQAVK